MALTFCLKLRIQTFIACIVIGLFFVQCEPEEYPEKEEFGLVQEKESLLLAEIDSLFDSREFAKAIEVSRSFLLNKKAATLYSGLIMIKLFQGLNYAEKEDSSQLVFSDIISFAQHKLAPDSTKILIGKAYLSKAKILQDLDLYDSSTVFLQKARDFLPENYADDYAYSCILSTKVAYFNYQNEEAKNYLDLAQKLNNTSQLSDRILTLIDNWYSLVLEWDGEFEEAIKHSENILTRLNKKNILSSIEETNLLDTYQNLGTIYTSKGDISKGLKYYSRALNYETNKLKPDSVYIASLLNNVGYGLMSQFDYAEAIKQLNKSYKILTYRKGDELIRRTKIETYLHLAFCHQELGNIDSTFIFSHLALKLQTNSPIDLDYTFLNIAAAHYLKKNYREALDTVNLSIEQAVKTYGLRHRFVSRSYSLLGEILEGQNRYQESLHAFQDALISSSKIFSEKHYAKNPEPELVFDEKGFLKNLENKLRILIKLHKQEPSNSAYLKASWETKLTALQVIEQLRNDYSDDESKFQLLQVATPIYDMSLQTATLLDKGSQDPDLLAQAFQISEQGKSMILQDNMRSAFALQSPEIPESLRRKEDSLRINISFYGQRVRNFENQAKLTSYDSTQYKSAQRISLDSEESYAKLLTGFAEKFPDYVKRKKGQEAVPVDNIFTYLDTAQLSLVEYFWGKKNLYAFLLHEGKIRMFELPKDQQLEEEMEAWRNSVSNSTEVFNQGNSPESLATFKKAGFAIYQQILAPVLQDLPKGRNLVIIPDGPLNLFPFDALLHSEEDSISGYENLDYLLHHHQIQFALSASLLLKGYPQTQAKYDFLGYAPSYEAARSLDFNEQEVQKIATLIEGKTVMGASANKENFREHAPKARFLHLSQHAINEQDPLMSHLLFSAKFPDATDKKEGNSLAEQVDPQKLHAYEIYNQKLVCELAVLNACETGDGMLIQGEGMLSLSRAFRHAGAESVIMNTWRVHDEAAFRILSEFYALLVDNHDTASALRGAKINYLKISNKTHPYFWAGSALIGKAKKPVFKPQVRALGTGLDYGLFVGLWALGILFLLGIILHLSGKVYPRHPDTFN